MVNDPISDFIIRLKNASMVKKGSISVPFSKIKLAIAEVLQKEGFVSGVEKRGRKLKKFIDVSLKYSENGPEVTDVKRLSKPGKRVYLGFKDIRSVKQGHGIMVISTPKGLMSDKEAKEKRLGGEALFSIW